MRVRVREREREHVRTSCRRGNAIDESGESVESGESHESQASRSLHMEGLGFRYVVLTAHEHHDVTLHFVDMPVPVPVPVGCCRTMKASSWSKVAFST